MSSTELLDSARGRLPVSTSTRFNKFLRNITLTPQQVSEAEQRFRNVAMKLHSYYYPSTMFTAGATAMKIGSYGKGTAVRPPRDVDVLFLMPSNKFWQYDTHLGNGQSQLLQAVRAVLGTRYPTTSIRGDGQVVVVPFVDGHTVEVLPAWRLTNGKYRVPNTHRGGSWNIVDHAAEIANVADSDQQYAGNTRNLIKMMKIWQAYCNVPIKSLVLELRSVNFMSTWEHRHDGTMFYDWMVRDFFRELIAKANSWCTIPGTDEKCLYGDTWLSRAQTAYNRAVDACNYEANDDNFNAVTEWRMSFGSQFEY
jgi:hypothetical protein